jgi:hypothetical protein
MYFFSQIDISHRRKNGQIVGLLLADLPYRPQP